MDQTDSSADLLRDSAVDFLSGRAGRSRLRGWIGRPRAVDRALWREAAELGWTGLLLPDSLGGLGLGLGDAAVLATECGRHLFAEPLIASMVLPSLLLAEAVEPSHGAASTLAQTLIAGERVLAVAWQQRAGQLDSDQPSCRVDDGRLSGRACFVGGFDAEGILLVLARDGDDLAWFAVDAAADGVQSRCQPAGLSIQAELVFERVRLADPLPLLHGVAARVALLRMLAGGRLLLAAELIGLASGCLDLTLDHVRTRQQFDRTIGSFQSVQHRCVDMYIEVELARASLQQALAAAAADGDLLLPAVDAAICAAKARAGDAALLVARQSVQLLGAMGFCDEVDVGLYLRAALFGNAWLGNPTVLRRRFAAYSPEQSPLRRVELELADV